MLVVQGRADAAFTLLAVALGAIVLEDDAAPVDDVEGVGEARARAIKEGLSRLAESSVLDRYN